MRPFLYQIKKYFLKKTNSSGFTIYIVKPVNKHSFFFFLMSPG